MSTYRERREARAGRYRGWAAKREVDAAAVFKAGEPYRGDIAFLTQPGHIPLRARVIAREDRAYESLRKAQSMTARASGIESQLAGAIYSDDPDAIEQLQARIVKLEAQRDKIKARNAAFRKEHKAGLAAMTPYQRDQAMPHRGWELTNLSANIKRNKDRLVGLERQQAATAAADYETGLEDGTAGDDIERQQP